MPKQTVVKLLPPDEHCKVGFTVVTRGEVYSEYGEIVALNEPGLGGDLDHSWNSKRFIATDESGQRTYCVPGDIAPSRKYAELGWGFALAVEATLKQGSLVYARTPPHCKLELLIINAPWTIGDCRLQSVSKVVVTSARHLDIAKEPDIPAIDDTSFEVLERELIDADFGPSLHAIARTILDTPIKT